MSATLCAFIAFTRTRHAQDETQTLKSALDAQRILRQQDYARWEALLKTTDDAILLVDAVGKLLVHNEVADHLFATQALPADQDPLTTAPRGTLLAYTLSSELDELYRKAIHRHSAVEDDIVLSPTNRRSLHLHIMPVSESEFLIVLRDLTELRRLESIRRDFVANVSHELRTPLTSIKAMAETLLDGALQDEAVATRFLETIIHESDRLARLSADLLELSRVEARGIQKEPVDLSALVTDVSMRLASAAQKAGVEVSNHLPATLMISADGDEMAQVLVNLLDNAINYTPRNGRVTITINETEQQIMLSVADTGIGILSQDIPRLFERFYRVDRARSRASGGTGLGLSIVKHIIERHGGTVHVESEYNRGSVFTFTLPK